MRRLLGLLILFVVTTSVCAQQIGQNKPADAGDTYTLSVKVQLVVEPVVVKDKDGKPIHGLTAKDFAITEDGVPQTVRVCEHQDLAAQAALVPVAAPGTEEVKLYKELARTQIKPESIDDDRYKDRRLLALYFDMSAMRPADQLRSNSFAPS